ncbi:leucine-rich repeat protein, partial [Tanacetum coccineum]
HLCLSNQNFDDVLCIKEERHALLQFKHRLIDEGGRLASWVGEQSDCCKWAGIVCDNKTGHVHQIHLRAFDGHCAEYFDTQKEEEEASKQKLKGDLSPSLLDLKQLEHLDLSCNDFGQIQVPEFIGSLRNLRYLNLSSSNFSGIIPPQLGNISELHTLCLGSFQDWRGESTRVMNMEWLSNLRVLRHLDMSYVDLSQAMDWLQVINTLPSLAELHFQNSYLLDIHLNVPSLNTTSLLLLDLSGNQFTNSLVPRWIFSISSLVSLDISTCEFNDLIPSRSAHIFRNLTSLKWFHVSGNNFMNSSLVLKELSSGIGSNLISLDISHCHISSTALDSLHNLTSLLSLDLSRNQLTNIIPKSLGNLCNLRDIDLSYNSLQNIGVTYLLEGFTEHLESLSMRSSGLSGTIPDSIGRLSLLKRLDLSYNQFNGSLPDSIINPTIVIVGGFRAFRKSTKWCRNRNSLSQTRALEISVFENKSRKQLNTKNLRICKSIHSFQLRLSGVIPECWEKWQRLSVLNLENNKLSGGIPRTLGRVRYIKSLSMRGNKLDGKLPASLMNLTYLVILELSGNELAGSIPSWIGTKLSFLRLLNLRSNNFVGNIPHELCYLVQIQILDLSNNKLMQVMGVFQNASEGM